MTQSQKAIVIAKAENLQIVSRSGDARKLARVSGIPETRISEALMVLKHAPGLADDVLAKTMRLDEAVTKAESYKL
jgi:hypothetical protein